MRKELQLHCGLFWQQLWLKDRGNLILVDQFGTSEFELGKKISWGPSLEINCIDRLEIEDRRTELWYFEETSTTYENLYLVTDDRIVLIQTNGPDYFLGTTIPAGQLSGPDADFWITSAPTDVFDVSTSEYDVSREEFRRILDKIVKVNWPVLSGNYEPVPLTVTRQDWSPEGVLSPVHEDDVITTEIETPVPVLRCECGADACGYPFHSDYCPKSKEET